MELLLALLSVLGKLKVAKDGRHYFVLEGKCKYLPKGTIIHEAQMPTSTTTNKEKTMKVIQYLMEHKLFGDIRIITNHPLADEAIKYTESVKKGMPVDGLMAIDSGNYMPRMLMERLHDKPFRLTIIANGCITPHPKAPQYVWDKYREAFASRVARANFAWANSASTFLLQFFGVRTWGLEPMGLAAIDAPKTAKRNNEIVRSSGLSWYTDDPEEIANLKFLKWDPSGIPVKARDGAYFVSKSLMMKFVMQIQDEELRNTWTYKIKSGKVRRFNGRFNIPAGVIDDKPHLIKGDFVVMPDKWLGGYDLITCSDNLKSELTVTENFVLATAEEHHATHEPTWDIMRITQNPLILTHTHRQRDLDTFVASIMKIKDDGTMPELFSLEEDNDASAILGSSRNAFRDDTISRWSAAGLPVGAASNALRMLLNGQVVNQMAKDFESYKAGKAIGWARSMFLPKSNALVAAIIAHGNLTVIGGQRTRHNGKRAWFDPTIGIVIPDQRFVDIYNLIGGGDSDDTAELDLVKLWSSDPAATKMHRENGVIGKDHKIATSKKDAKFVAAVLRNPNGAGEFSFLEIDGILELPWYGKDLDNVEVIDLAEMPQPQGEMIKTCAVMGMTPSVTHTRQSWTPANALAQIMAQQDNPGIGGAANAMMVWSSVAGPSMPPMIVAPFEQLVDGAQQLSDPAIFAAVRSSAEMTTDQVLTLMRTQGINVERYMIPKFYGDDAREAAMTMSYDGPMTQFMEAYRQAIADIYGEIVQRVLQIRDREPLIHWVRQLQFNAEARVWAQEFASIYSRKLAAIDNQFNNKINEAKENNGRKRKSIKVVLLERTKHAALRQCINEAVAELNKFERPGQRALAVWQACVKSTGKFPMGGYDRVIFQQGDGVSIMDIIIETLHTRAQTDQALAQIINPVTNDEHESLIPEMDDPNEFDMDDDIAEFNAMIESMIDAD